LFTGAKQNVLTFRIQPDERVQMLITNKVPGFGIQLQPGNLEFGYKANFQTEIPPAYERLLLDFLQGDQRLFIRSDEIEAPGSLLTALPTIGIIFLSIHTSGKRWAEGCPRIN